MSDESFPRVETPRLELYLPSPEKAARILQHVADNRQHLERWSPPAPPDFYTEEFWRQRLEVARLEFEQGRSLQLFMFLREIPDGATIGLCSFSNIIRGGFQAGHLGYHIDYRAEGKGLMFEALSYAIPYAFKLLRLHRIMANYIPVNERSGKLLRRLGFVVEGYARDYLFIGGAWQDHILTAIHNPQFTWE